MDDGTCTAEQRAALTAANLVTNRVPLYYNYGRLSKAAIRGLIARGLLIQESTKRLVLTTLGRKEAQRLLTAEEVPGF
jgi:hypothetical protein